MRSEAVFQTLCFNALFIFFFEIENRMQAASSLVPSSQQRYVPRTALNDVSHVRSRLERAGVAARAPCPVPRACTGAEKRPRKST